LFRELDDPWGLSLALNNLGLQAYRQGDFTTARSRLEEALAIRRQVGDKWLIAQSLNYLGNAARAQGDTVTGVEKFQESLRLNRELGNKHGIAECFEGLAKMAGTRQQPERAARLFGAAEGLRQAIGAPLPLSDRSEYERSVVAIRGANDPVAFDRAWAEGRTRIMERMIDYALQVAA
jgi:tetratricopeptide (TPR) repeat protein